MIGRAPFHGLRFAGRRFDCGGKLGYLEAIVACALERADLRDGVREMREALSLTCVRCSGAIVEMISAALARPAALTMEVACALR